MVPTSPDSHDLGAAAADPGVTDYRPNGPDSPAPRTAEGLLAWAAARGVTVPEWCAVRIVPDDFGPQIDHRPVRAAYFLLSRVAPDRVIRWRGRDGDPASVVNPRTGKVSIRIRESAAETDEEFLHLLAHEVFEADRLREEFAACGGRMTAAAVHELTRAARGLNNLHSEAWDHADAVLERLRSAPDVPPDEVAS